MKVEVVNLRKDRPVVLTAYIVDSSQEISWKKRSAVVICPGGAFLFTSDREAEPVALKFLSKGYNAFVLRYTTASMGTEKVYPDVLYDLANAVVTIRKRAEDWNTDPEKVVIVGFSAGGALASLYSVMWHRKWLSETLNVSPDVLKPSAVILAYPGVDYVKMYEIFKKSDGPASEMFFKSTITVLGTESFSVESLKEISATYHVDKNVPPTFIWTTSDDEYVPVESVITYVQALAQHGVPFEFHVFEKGGHGLSLADRTTARTSDQINPHVAKWIDLAFEWLEEHLWR
ncbi:hypothetical protein TRQ7_09270 [Thermotoga sp. RQ7]|uniref:alpha/beta hydrolase n=1 Tax=Thermotoga sp. RQ7 TaxID=126738 RepID=UPI0005A31FBC|nr:alpha/beta hydrolase [Thermotoga sp. RQ7]AJG41630.1 hypothetical protein TRQ7_09270 [Thermotoga sp. RQ7]